MAKAEQKNKVFIKKLHDENEQLKGSTTWLKSQDEKLQNLRLKVNIQETIKRKWTKVHKNQQEALVSQMKALTKQKKEKDIVLIDLEFINLKNVFCSSLKSLKKRQQRQEKNN